jgi:hypothetical protein
MKKLFLIGAALAALLALAFSDVIAQENIYIPMGKMNDSLTVATSQIYDTSTTLAPSLYSYIAAVIKVDRLMAGSAGAGYFYFEGSYTPTKYPTAYAGSCDTSSYWIRIPFLSVTDSLEMKTSEVMSGYADISYAAILSIMPNSFVKGWASGGKVGAIEGAAMFNYLPFNRIRMIISDTNWNIKAKVYPYWVVRK